MTTSLSRLLRIVDTSASREKNEDDISDNVASPNVDESWNSGARAPQHIDLDLGSVKHVTQIDLLPYQVPTPALTRHRVWAGETLEDLRVVREVEGESKHHEWVKGVALQPEGGKPVRARFVRIETVEHPGWPAWSGIRVHGKD